MPVDCSNLLYRKNCNYLKDQQTKPYTNIEIYQNLSCLVIANHDVHNKGVSINRDEDDIWFCCQSSMGYTFLTIFVVLAIMFFKDLPSFEAESSQDYLTVMAIFLFLAVFLLYWGWKLISLRRYPRKLKLHPDYLDSFIHKGQVAVGQIQDITYIKENRYYKLLYRYQLPDNTVFERAYSVSKKQKLVGGSPVYVLHIDENISLLL